MASQLLPLVAQMIVGPRRAQSFAVFWRNLRADTAIAFAQVVLAVTFLAYHAWDTAHAIVLTLVRLAITRRRLLEWETAASTAARAAGINGGRALLRFATDMMASPTIAAVVLLLVSISRPSALSSALPSSRCGSSRRPRLLVEHAGGAASARRSRIAIGRCSERRRARPGDTTRHSSRKPTRGCRPTTIRKATSRDLARRTSPTNIGMALLVDAGRARSRISGDGRH